MGGTQLRAPIMMRLPKDIWEILKCAIWPVSTSAGRTWLDRYSYSQPIAPNASSPVRTQNQPFRKQFTRLDTLEEAN